MFPVVNVQLNFCRFQVNLSVSQMRSSSSHSQVSLCLVTDGAMMDGETSALGPMRELKS